MGLGARPADEAVPAGMRLQPDSGTRLVAGGAVLLGGSPARVLRLTSAGARQVAAWFAGGAVPSSAAARTLARRLLDAGIAHPGFASAGRACVDEGAAGEGAAGEGASGEGAGVYGEEGPGGEGPGGEGPGGEGAGGEGAGPYGDARLPGPADVTVVIPVRDRHAELARCLAGLRGQAATPAVPRVVVVDDASADGRAIARICARYGAAVIRRGVNGGPGAARNTGLAEAGTELVAFLDSDCVPANGWLDGLLPHFADPAVGAVAPRIVPYGSGTGWLARYEGASSTLDMGARPSIVRPGARVSYVPGAALVVRRRAAGDGFAPGMYVGEDVDFVWRLAAAGWRVRYEPAAVMAHDHRVAFRAWFARRAEYGTSAAALEQLHPGAVRPLYASWWTVGAWATALSGRPIAAVAITGTATALLARRLSRVTGERWPVPSPPAAERDKHVHEDDGSFPTPEGGQRAIISAEPSSPEDNSKKRSRWMARTEVEAVAWRLAVRLAGGGTVAAGRPLGSALSRTWWPAALPAALAFRRLRVPVAALILAPPLFDWADRRPPLDPARYVAARLLDDAAYSLGVWKGCLDRRTLRPLLPVIGARREPG